MQLIRSYFLIGSRKYFIGIFLIIMGYTKLNAQEAWTIGAGPSLELDNGLLGFNTRLYYGPNERICFGPEVSIFPYGDIGEDLELTVLELNFNAHYIFELAENFGVYGLSGLNYTDEKKRPIQNDGFTETENAFGINYGVGMHYQVSGLFIFAEFKGIVGQLADEFVSLGVIFSLSKENNKK